MWAPTEPHGPSARVGCRERGTDKSRPGSSHGCHPSALRSWLDTERPIEICEGCLRTKAQRLQHACGCNVQNNSNSNAQ